MGNRSKRKRKRGFKWHEKSSVPEELDTLEESESEKSLTIHSASYRKLRLLSTRTVIDIHFFSIRSLTFYFSIPIISIRW